MKCLTCFCTKYSIVFSHAIFKIKTCVFQALSPFAYTKKPLYFFCNRIMSRFLLNFPIKYQLGKLFMFLTTRGHIIWGYLNNKLFIFKMYFYLEMAEFVAKLKGSISHFRIMKIRLL